MLSGRYTGKNVVITELDKIGELVQKGYGKKEEEIYNLSGEEALYLLKKDKIEVLDEEGDKYDFERFLTRLKEDLDKFWTRFKVYEDLRERGYIIKTALKYGADFRVYPRGCKPGEEHAKWLLFAVHESGRISWKRFSALNRVAHSVRKNLLIGILDDEGDITYYEISWKRL